MPTRRGRGERRQRKSLILSCSPTQDFEHVYEPSEDTFLLLDALEAEAPQLHALR